MEDIAIHHLRIMPDLVQELINGISEEQAAAKKSPDEHSLAELLEYLSHIEGHYFRARLDVFLTHPNSGGFANYDAGALFRSGAYSNRDAEESFAHWQEQRDDSLEILENLDEEDAAVVTLLLPEWAAHDLATLGRITNAVARTLYEAPFGERIA